MTEALKVKPGCCTFNVLFLSDHSEAILQEKKEKKLPPVWKEITNMVSVYFGPPAPVR